MLRDRPHRPARPARRGVRGTRPALGWLALAALYLAAAVLNLLLAISTGRMWPLALAGALVVIAGVCVAAAARGPRR